MVNTIKALFPKAEFIRHRSGQSGLFHGVAIVEEVSCISAKSCVNALPGASWVSGSAIDFPMIMELATGKQVGHKHVKKRVTLYEDHFELSVDDTVVANRRHDISLSLWSIDNKIPYTQHDNIFRFVSALKLCAGFSIEPTKAGEEEAPIDSANIRRYHSAKCHKLLLFNRRRDHCDECKLALLRYYSRRTTYVNCPNIVGCLEEENIYVGGDMGSLPVQCCILDVTNKMNGRYVTKSVSFYENYFTLSVDGLFVDLAECLLNDQIRISQHHHILSKVKALKICNGLDKKETLTEHDFIVEREHQSGSDPQQTRVHAIDCNIVIYGFSNHCAKCDAIRFKPLTDCLAGICAHGLFVLYV